jgi:hypothetical protein
MPIDLLVAGTVIKHSSTNGTGAEKIGKGSCRVSSHIVSLPTDRASRWEVSCHYGVLLRLRHFLRIFFCHLTLPHSPTTSTVPPSIPDTFFPLL